MGKPQEPSTAASESRLSEASNSASVSVTLRCNVQLWLIDSPGVSVAAFGLSQIESNNAVFEPRISECEVERLVPSA